VRNTHDEEGIMIAQRSSINGHEAKIEWKHDSIGNLLEEGQYLDDDDVLFSKKKYVYNSRNLLTKITTTDKDNKIMILEFSYDSLGNFIENYGKYPRTSNRYKIYSTNYEYDHSGNWTRRITRDIKNVITEVVIRGIVYY
jgi:hypothetical protein